MIDEDVQRESLPFDSDPSRKALIEKQRVLPKWVSSDSLYWMFALIPKGSQAMDLSVLRTGYNLKANKTAEVTQTAYEAWIRQPIQNLLPGESLEFHYKLFFGPKDETILNAFKGSELSESIDYGFFKIIAKPLYKTLSYINGLVNNWGFSIILLTILINIILLPLQIKAYRAAKQMQKIQPEMKKVQEKYKGDRQKLQQETMALMSKNRVNPMSGCLPMLPQIPVFFGLNSCLMHTFELRQAPFIFWLKDLSVHDPFFLLPIIMAFLMILYQKMMPMPVTDPTQAKIMKVLPIVFSVFMVFYPSGLALYVITNTFISMVRQLFLNRKYK
jgi:YidC/Oxa1 family membrane protein insertase